MSLIDFKEQSPPYMVMSGTTPIDVASTANFLYFQSLKSSNRITKTSNTRITFEEDGVYEVSFSCRLAANPVSVQFYSMAIQYGINGAWTTLESCTSGNFIWVVYSRSSFIIEVNAGDYLELRSLMGAAMNQNITFSGIEGSTTSSIKRLS
jgi:hypothetical protein